MKLTYRPEIDSLNIFCDEINCHSISTSGDILYSDRDHLSLKGATKSYTEIKKIYN